MFLSKLKAMCFKIRKTVSNGHIYELKPHLILSIAYSLDSVTRTMCICTLLKTKEYVYQQDPLETEV